MSDFVFNGIPIVFDDEAPPEGTIIPIRNEAELHWLGKIFGKSFIFPVSILGGDPELNNG
jgi:hypothetical protein